MNIRNLFPYPYRKVWTAAYTDGTVECFEIRTVDKANVTPYAIIWHGEYPMGASLADFLYSDLSTWDWHLEQIQELLEGINKGGDEEDAFDHLKDYARFWLRESPLFAPVAASLERLRLTREEGETLSTAELGRQMAWFRQLQPRLLNLAHALFETDDPTNLEEKYTELWRSDKETYPSLRYGQVELQEVWRGGGNFTTYDDPSDILDQMDTERPPQEFFTTEVISSESPEDIVNFLLVRYMQNNLQMKPCKYCGKYFATKRAYKTDYCDRLIAGSTKTCREAGSLRLYEKRKLEDPAIKEYKRSYKAHNARIRYGLMTRAEFADWSKQAREKRDLCVAGKLSLEDFIAWLDSDKM